VVKHHLFSRTPDLSQKRVFVKMVAEVKTMLVELETGLLIESLK